MFPDSNDGEWSAHRDLQSKSYIDWVVGCVSDDGTLCQWGFGWTPRLGTRWEGLEQEPETVEQQLANSFLGRAGVI